jgi:fumarate hydratase subunit beta
MTRISTPFTPETIKTLRVCDRVLLSGQIYTGRDAAHKRMMELLDADKPLPFAPEGQAIYYAGPCPAPPGHVIGSVGPTTSLRMDAYAPRLIEAGLRVMIGKGTRSDGVAEAMKRHTGLYLSAIGGAGALYSTCVTEAELVAFGDLGPEAVYRLVVKDMPLVVAGDCYGGKI